MIDLVIIEGDPNILPWERRCFNIKTLFEVCKATNKAMFVSGIGVQLLVHFCAIGEKRIHVINGNEKGTLLSEIRKYEDQEALLNLS